MMDFPPTDLHGLAEKDQARSTPSPDTMEVTDRNLGGRYSRTDPAKLRFELIPQDALAGVADVLRAGALKYGVRNWEKGLPWLETYGSFCRHMNAFILGKDVDADSGCQHIDLAVTNMLMLSAMVKRRPDLDDLRLKEVL